jgi:hypothetical protein
MELADIECGPTYKCDYAGGQYFAIVIEKDATRVRVRLGDKVDEHGDRGDPTERLGTIGPVWVQPGALHEM